MRELDKVLNQNEKVLWEGGPKFWPFFFGRSLFLTIAGIFWVIILLVFFVNSWSDAGEFRYLIFVTPHFWIGLLLLFGPTIYAALVFKHTYYAITDKRVIIQKGLIGRDFENIDLDQVTSAEVDVGVFDKLFGNTTGSILLGTAVSSMEAARNTMQNSKVMNNVTNPYEVFKFFKKVSHDVRTDVQYPNKLRPEENPGYPTNLSQDKNK